MSKTVQDYIDSPIINLPIEHPDPGLGLGVQELAIGCSECGSRLEDDISGRVTMHSGCIEIEAGAPCDECKHITFVHLRFYPERVVANFGGEWVELKSNREKGVFRQVL